MTISTIADVEFGAELAGFEPDTSLSFSACVRARGRWGAGARFNDHDKARAEGLPGALVPGIMAMGFLTTMIHRWSPAAHVERIDTVFRAPLIADEPCTLSAVVTDVDAANGFVELDLSVKNAAAETRVFGTARVRLPPA